MSDLQLFNTMTRNKETFRPIEADKARVYTCGPTVYLEPHIGNWRTFIFYDTLIRALQHAGYQTNHVINITDVGHLVSDGDEGEDKLAKQAKAERKTAWEIADYYTERYLAARQQLNMLTPSETAKATDYIDQQIALVQKLEAAGVTYVIDDGVYFDISKVDNYGKLARLDVAGQEAGARVATNDQKRQPQDFALWKFSPKDEQRDMEWSSPWGTGFPGWHLECSAIAEALLGDTIDIHAGGIDHIPVHHTNEIAQSETAHKAKFAHYWLHAEFMMVDSQKMSKSLGNYYHLADIADKGFDALTFRLLILQGHYRSQTNFTWDNMQSAQNRLIKLRQLAERRWQPVNVDKSNQLDVINQAVQAFTAAINDDINTPRCLQVISSVEAAVEDGLSQAAVADFASFLELCDQLLGLELIKRSAALEDGAKQVLDARQQARDNKDFSKSDELRDALLTDGIEVKDTPNGQIWQRTKLYN